MERLAAVEIDPDIRRARTQPAWIYSDPAMQMLQRERVFASSWQWVGDRDRALIVRLPATPE